MLKQSSSRNQRTKGYKVKNTLQVCVLVAVCVWLLYQIKHSHDKKMALEERKTKTSSDLEDTNLEILKFGRKVLPQVSVETNAETVTHNDEEGSEEGEEAKSETRHEEDEVEEVKGSREDEIDENDQEGADEEAEHSEDSIDDVEKDGQSDESGLLGNKDHESAEANSQEAREEHYKGDDASSAVVRGSEITESEAGNLDIGNLNEEQMENAEKDLEIGNKTTVTEDGPKGDELGVLLENGENHVLNSSSMTGAIFVESEHDAESQANSTTVESSNHMEESSNSTLETPSPVSVETLNRSAAVVDDEINGSSLQNLTISIDSSHDQNSTAETGTSGADKASTSLEFGNSASQEILTEQAEKTNVVNITERAEESYNASLISTETETSIQAEINDPSVKLDTVTEEERDARTDLSTLAETQTETKIEEIAAE